MGWVIAIAVILLIGMIPLGARICYDAEGLAVKIIAGVLRFTLFPLEPRNKTRNKKPKTASTPKKEPKTEFAPEAPKEKKGGSLKDFLPFVKLALDFLDSFRRKIRLDQVQVKLILAGDDPCDLAVNYGRAWSALGNFVPALERYFHVGRRDFEVECDFMASETKIIFHMDVTITVGRLMVLGVRYGYLAIKEFFAFKKKRKGGAVV